MKISRISLPFLGALASLLWAGGACAIDMSAPHAHGDLILKDGWVRETIGPATISAAYLTIENLGEDEDALIGVSTENAEAAELHTHEMTDGVMRMRRADEIVVPAGGAVALAPGGDHIMLIGIADPLKVGDQVTLTLTFRTQGAVTLALPVGSGGMAH